jgi:hypothetical protein
MTITMSYVRYRKDTGLNFGLCYGTLVRDNPSETSNSQNIYELGE